MSIPLRVLVVEDSENDTLLIVDELRRGGYAPLHQRVENREQMEAALDRQEWDVIIADYRLPDFDGLEALEIASPRCDSCPFIIVSGQISEDTAVSAMRAGATDYVLKNNLARLVPAVERELREAQSRRQRRTAEEALHEERERCVTILESITDGFYAVDMDWRFTYINEEGARLLGREWQALKGQDLWATFPHTVGTPLHTTLQGTMLEGTPGAIEWFSERTEKWFAVRSYPYPGGIAVYIRDISEQKHTEEALRTSEERFRALTTATSDVIYNMSADWAVMRNLSGGGFLKDTGAPISGWLAVYIPAEEQARVMEAIDEAIRSKRVFELEHRVIRADGGVGWTFSRAIPVLDDKGEVVEWFGAARDISVRKQQELEIQEALERERHFSLLLQRALLPEKPSLDHGYSVAVEYIPFYMGREIGGDFYDVFEAEGGKVGVVIGDVSGKGLESAALAAATRSTIHALAYETGCAGETLARANSILCSGNSDGLQSDFVTVFLAVIDLDTGEFCYASAGHPPAAICRKGGEVEFLQLNFLPPICVLSGITYQDYTDRLEPGDVLVMFTDGIIEARRSTDLFDLEGIEQSLREHRHRSVDDIADELIAAASSWAQGRLSDDAAVVVVKREERH